MNARVARGVTLPLATSTSAPRPVDSEPEGRQFEDTEGAAAGAGRLDTMVAEVTLTIAVEARRHLARPRP